MQNPTNESNSLQRTADLARRLFQVPKAELKAEEAKYEAERAKLEKRPGRKPKQAIA
jgi:hypothetical protein